jgi:hypothetical protein
MGYIKKTAIALGFAFLTTSTVKYWTQKPQAPVIVYLQAPKPARGAQGGLEKKIAPDDISSVLKVAYVR